MKTKRLTQLIREYFNLGVIIGALPSVIANGQAVDAIPLMNDLNWIVAQVNANAAAVSAVPVFTSVTAFTPSVAFGGSSVGVTYAFRAGAYVKIATMVLFALDVLLTSKGAAVGVATIEGLPFAPSGGFPAGSTAMCPVITSNVTFAAGYLAGFIGGGTNISIINPVTAAGYNTLTNVAFANNSEVLITGMYST
jgi:hypothetical protein